MAAGNNYVLLHARPCSLFLPGDNRLAHRHSSRCTCRYHPPATDTPGCSGWIADRLLLDLTIEKRTGRYEPITVCDWLIIQLSVVLKRIILGEGVLPSKMWMWRWMESGAFSQLD